MGKVAYVFPGQGSQFVGMGKELFESSVSARRVFEEADDALGFALSQLMFSGSEDELRNTCNAQPAILTHSNAHLARVRETNVIEPDFVAGHSLGEYSALVASGVMSFADAVKSVRFRGQAMQEAVPLGKGSMAAILGLPAHQIEKICLNISSTDDRYYVAVANFNSPLQTVIAGTVAGVNKAIEQLKEMGAKRTIVLNVSAPFHCKLMIAAREKLAQYLSGILFLAPKIPVVTNVKAEVVTQSDELRKQLISQVTSPVRFTQMIETMNFMGVKSYNEIGPGKVLTGLIRNINNQSSKEMS